MNVYYLCRYADSENKQNRTVFLSAVNKINYIIDCIIKAGHTVTVVSFADSADSKNKKGEFKKIKDNLFLKTFFSVGNKNVFARVFGRNLLKLQYLIYLLKTVKPNDTLIVYHSPFYFKLLKILKSVLKCKLILEVEEIYSDISIPHRLRKKEIESCSCADAYIFPSVLLNETVNLENKPVVYVHGAYKISKKIGNRFNDGKTHCVYAGTFDATKGGAFAAIGASEYLDSNYHMHILGFGTDLETQTVIDTIDRVCKKTECTVTFDGCLSGEHYISFIQSCEIGLSCQNPSGIYNDTSFPSKILSYMSNGLKVVSIRIPAVESSAVGEYLYYYDEQTPQNIANAIKKAAALTAQDSRETVEKLDKQFLENIREILN